MIAALVGMVLFVVSETNRIENQMVVNMSLVDMGGKYKLVLAPQYFFFQLYPNLMVFSRNTSPGSKACIRWRPKCVLLPMK